MACSIAYLAGDLLFVIDVDDRKNRFVLVDLQYLLIGSSLLTDKPGAQALVAFDHIPDGVPKCFHVEIPGQPHRNGNVVDRYRVNGLFDEPQSALGKRQR
ncbi:hypothetical protein MSIMFI_05551 [Mycobacterium simulans]|nr:hypothetical protein MSIMFI_05551 [Mycobacterium simulans]